MTFDFTAYKEAFERRDAARWLSFYAPEAEWIEYRHTDPPRSPNVMRGHKEIGGFLADLEQADIGLAISHEVISEERIAFAVWVTLPNRDRIIEHIILELSGGLIARQVDVEAWD